MNNSKFLNKALIDENVDLEYSIKDNIIIGKSLPDDLESESIGKLLLKNLSDYPHYVGQINVHTGEKTTFADFKDRCVRCALWLKKQGIGKGDVISTLIPLQDGDYVPVLAALFIGAITNPWPYGSTPLAVEHFFKLVRPKIIFTTDEKIEMLVKAAKDTQIDCKFVVLGKHPEYPSLNDLMAEQDQLEVDQFCHVEPKDPRKEVGALFFTSGTTSFPKAVELSYESLVKNRFHYMFSRTHCNGLWYPQLSWNTGFFLLTMCIRKFITRILHVEFSPEETAAVIEKFMVNMIFTTPTKITQLCMSDAVKKYDFSKLEVVLNTGSKPSSAMMEAARKLFPHAHVANSLGMTDTSGRLTVQTKKCKTKNSLGRIVGSVQLKIINPKTGVSLGANQEGEMCYKLDGLMLGYLNDPEETKKAIDEEGWFHSGDLGYYDENGEIWITDRLKQIIIYQAKNLSPSTIEELLLQHPDVVDVAVVPVLHEIDGERPFAFVVKKPDAQVTLEELKELPAKYDKTMRLTGGVVFTNEIPYNANGKKSIKDLKEMARAYAEK